jgi:hypothetical protein
MPRLSKNSDRDFSASHSEDDIHADIAESFASQPPEWDDFSADPLVRMRKGNARASGAGALEIFTKESTDE